MGPRRCLLRLPRTRKRSTAQAPRKVLRHAGSQSMLFVDIADEFNRFHGSASIRALVDRLNHSNCRAFLSGPCRCIYLMDSILEGPLAKGFVAITVERCKGCGFCVEFCPTHVLALSSAFNSTGYHPPHVVDADKCSGCDLCGMYCPDFAIFGARYAR